MMNGDKVVGRFERSEGPLSITITSILDWDYHGVQVLLAMLVLTGVVYCIYTKTSSSTPFIPGPWLARHTNLARFWTAARGNQMAYHVMLHEKYGPVVRVGPNCVSISDGRYIPKIYGSSGKLSKTSFYKCFDAAPGLSTNFSAIDEAHHKTLNGQLGAVYSIASLREMEHLYDECTSLLITKTGKLADLGSPFDLGDWMQWYATDVITSLTFSRRLGCLENERDVDGINDAIYRRMQILSVVGQVPWLHGILWDKVLQPLLSKFDNTTKLLGFAATQVQALGESSKREKDNIVTRLKNRGVEDDSVLLHAVTNVFAGSDTTAITLTALFYYILQSQDIYQTLQSEVDKTLGEKQKLITYAEAQKLPYLQAVIKETLRLHPAVGMLLERRVPTGGRAIDKFQLRQGEIVGINPWLVGRNPNVFPNPEKFLPERWLEADAEQLREMERFSLAFGGGGRTCTGKAVALVEISKVVPELLRHFEFELLDAVGKKELMDYFFVWQRGIRCVVRRRKFS